MLPTSPVLVPSSAGREQVGYPGRSNTSQYNAVQFTRRTPSMEAAPGQMYCPVCRCTCHAVGHPLLPPLFVCVCVCVYMYVVTTDALEMTGSSELRAGVCSP